MPNGQSARATKKGMLPNNALDILIEMQNNSLLSVVKLADAGYTTIFHAGDGGVTVHWAGDVYIKVKKEAILQGWRGESGL